MKKLAEMSKGTNATAYIGFKIDPGHKQRLTDYCAANGLSMGKLLRNFINEFLAEVEASKDEI